MKVGNKNVITIQLQKRCGYSTRAFDIQLTSFVVYKKSLVEYPHLFCIE